MHLTVGIYIVVWEQGVNNKTMLNKQVQVNSTGTVSSSSAAVIWNSCFVSVTISINISAARCFVIMLLNQTYPNNRRTTIVRSYYIVFDACMPVLLLFSIWEFNIASTTNVYLYKGYIVVFYTLQVSIDCGLIWW